jgi:hypothetical protein
MAGVKARSWRGREGLLFPLPCWERAGQGFTHQLELAAGDVGNVHVVGGRAKILVLLAGEDVESDEMDLGVTVLAGLGGGHVDNLARAVLDHDKPVLSQSRALHGVGERGTGVGRLEGNIMVLWSRKTRQLAKFSTQDDSDG